MEAGKKRLAGDTARAATADEVKDLRREAGALKEVVADLVLENRLLKKKYDRGWGRRGMRYPASEKLEIIRLVEQSTCRCAPPWTSSASPGRRSKPVVRRFPAWRPRGIGGSPVPTQPGLEPVARRVRDQIVALALEEPELSPRELAV